MWSALLVCVFGYSVTVRLSAGTVLLLGMVLGYAGIASLALKKHKSAVAGSVVAAIVVAGRWLPMVLLNLWLFMSGDARYRDSPGTILGVVLYALIFAIPSTFLLAGYGLCLNQVIGLFVGRQNGRTA